MTDHANELRRYARKIAHPAGDVPAVMRAAADEIECLRSENAGLVDDMNLLRDNNTALRARIEAMEQQEPVAWTTKLGLELGNSTLGFDACRGNLWGEKGVPLYTRPGAKGEEPTPSIPEGWKPVPIEVIYLYSIMCAAFVPVTPQHKEIAIQLDLAKRAMLAAAPEFKP